MTETEIKEIVQKQRSYFYTGATLPVEKRLDALKKLKTCIQKYEPLINEALKRDLGKSNFESYGKRVHPNFHPSSRQIFRCSLSDV